MNALAQTRLLVVEDDLIVRALLAKRLEAEGYAVAAAADGREGLEAAKGFHPDLILTDWMMPGMDGAALLTALRADPALRRAYVIVLTSKDDRADRIASLDLGADDYLVKPWSDEELKTHVRAGLRIQRLQRELGAAERRAALLATATTLGHRINDPLTALAAALQAARFSLPRGQALGELLDHCQGQVDHIATAVAALRQLGDPQGTTSLGQQATPDPSLHSAGTAGSER